MTGDFRRVPLNKLQVRFTARRDFGDMHSLIESVSKHGIRDPLIVSETEDGAYVVIDGHRRYLAAKEAGLREVPVNVLGRDMDFDKVLQVVWEEDELKKKLTNDERAIIVNASVERLGVREAARRLRIPKSTAETLSKAGKVFMAVWRSVQRSDKDESKIRFKVNVKLAEAIARKLLEKGYSREEFDEAASKLYFSLSEQPLSIASLVLERWAENPSLENIDKLIEECRGLVKTYRFKPVSIDERVPIESSLKSSYEELLVKCGYDPRRSYKASSEVSLKLLDFMDGYEFVSGFLCPRCGQPVRCRVCGAIANCLCGYPHKSVRSRRYRYARLTVNEEG